MGNWWVVQSSMLNRRTRETEGNHGKAISCDFHGADSQLLTALSIYLKNTGLHFIPVVSVNFMPDHMI